MTSNHTNRDMRERGRGYLVMATHMFLFGPPTTRLAAQAVASIRRVLLCVSRPPIPFGETTILSTPLQPPPPPCGYLIARGAFRRVENARFGRLRNVREASCSFSLMPSVSPAGPFVLLEFVFTHSVPIGTERGRRWCAWLTVAKLREWSITSNMDQR